MNVNGKNVFLDKLVVACFKLLEELKISTKTSFRVAG
jgi:hypothetical protein